MPLGGGRDVGVDEHSPYDHFIAHQGEADGDTGQVSYSHTGCR